MRFWVPVFGCDFEGEREGEKVVDYGYYVPAGRDGEAAVLRGVLVGCVLKWGG